MISMAEFTEPKTVNCPDCESARVVKIGTRNGYQRYLCRACSKKSHANGKAKGRRFPADQMGAAIRMFYSGMSYQQIAESMGTTYDIPEPSKATIYQWVRDYTKDALKEMERHPAHTGGRWAVDEMQLDVGRQQYWIWNVMDESTGYLLASHLTKERDARSAEAVLKKAAAAATETPRTVKTDQWPYYVPAVKKVFPRTRHIRPPGGGKLEDIKNPSERVRGLFRQRTRTLREFGSKEKGQLYLDGWTLDYNLFRDHESTGGKPPGQAAKVNPTFNEWADVVKGRAHRKSAGPAGRTGETLMRVEIPAGVDVVQDVYNDPVPKRKPIPDGVDVVQDVYNDPVPKRKPIPDGVDVVQDVYNDPVPKRKPIPDGVDVVQDVYNDPVPKRKPIPDGVDVVQDVYNDPVPKRKPIPDGVDVVQDVYNDPVPKRKPIPDGVDVVQDVYNDPVPKRKPIPDGAKVAGKVDNDHRLKRPRGRRRTRAALKSKSGYKPRSPGHQGSGSRVSARRKIRT